MNNGFFATSGYRAPNNRKGKLPTSSPGANPTVIGAPSVPAAPVSIDFSTGFGTDWFAQTPDPTGTVGIVLNQARIVVPTGVVQEMYDNVDNAPRVSQRVQTTATSWEVQTKFANVPTQAIQVAGLYARADAANFVRLVFFSYGGILTAMLSPISGGAVGTSVSVDMASAAAGEGYLKLKRTANLWEAWASRDGSTWVAVGSFTLAVVNNEIGVYAGVGLNGTGYVLDVDYVFNTATPISPEDGAGTVFASPSDPQAVAVTTGTKQATVTWSPPLTPAGTITGYKIETTPSLGRAADRLMFKPGSDGPDGEAYMLDLEAWLGRQVYGVMTNGAIPSDSLSVTFGPYGPKPNLYSGATKRQQAIISITPFDPTNVPFSSAATASGRALIAQYLQNTLNGLYDFDLRAVARYMRYNPGFIANVAWEWNGGWMPWSPHGNEALWVQAVTYCIAKIRAEQAVMQSEGLIDGTRCMWGLCGAGTIYSTLSQATTKLVIDMCVANGCQLVGFTFYDALGGNTAAKTGVGNAYTWVNPRAVFAQYLQPDWDWWVARIMEHPGVNFFTSEWGLQGIALDAQGNSGASSVGGDDPEFLDYAFSLLNGLGSRLECHAYFEQRANGEHMVLPAQTIFPNASARFKELFGVSPASASSRLFKDLTSGQQYSFTVKAVNATGISAGSTVGPVTIP